MQNSRWWFALGEQDKSRYDGVGSDTENFRGIGTILFFLSGWWAQGVHFIVIYFFNKHLLSTCGGPNTAQGAGNRAGNKENKNPCLHGNYMLVNFTYK